MALDVDIARASLADSVQAAVAALGAAERLPALEAAHSMASAGALVMRAAYDLEEAAVFEAALAPVNLRDPGPQVPAGDRVRALRESMRLTRGDLAFLSEMSESTVRALEGGRPFRLRTVVCIAHGLAAVAHLGQIDAEGLAEQLAEAMERDGLLAKAGEFDDVWIERRLRRVKARDGDLFRRRLARRYLSDRR